MRPTQPNKIPASIPDAASTVSGYIRRRLQAGLLILGVTTAAILCLGLFAYLQTDEAYSQVVSQTALQHDLVIRLSDAVIAEVLHTRAFLITGDEQSIVSRDLSSQDFAGNYAALQTQLASLPPNAAATLRSLQAAHADYDAFAEEMIALRRAGGTQAAVREFDRNSDPLVRRMLSLRHELQATLQAALLEASWNFTRASSRIVLAVALAFGLTVAAGSLLVQRLLAPTLAALDDIERALADTVHQPGLALPKAGPARRMALFQAYDTLRQRLLTGEESRHELISRVAHDLRAPLAAIGGYAEVMIDETHPPDRAEVVKYAGIIARQSDRMDRVLAQMLTANRIEENRLALTLAPVRLDALLQAVAAEAARGAQREVHFEDRLPNSLVLGDALRLRELFANLLDNALKFSPAGALVQVTLSAAQQPGCLEVSISDQGIGIAPADFPRLFQRFSRIHSPDSRGVPGSGLGLYIARHLVVAHGGTILLQSEPASGTTVRVTLPLESEPAGAKMLRIVENGRPGLSAG